MFTKLKDWKLFEKKQKNAGTDLVIVDVQKSFEKFFGLKYLDELEEYCEEFQRVFQIYDVHDADEPDFLFSNQVKTLQKKYGGKLELANVEQYFPQSMWDDVKYKLDNIPDEGDIFDTLYGDMWVYIGRGRHNRGHEWFLCSKELKMLFNNFKTQNRTIILVGGAKDECLTDIYVTMKSLGVNVTYDEKYVYSFDGSNFQ